MMAEFNPLASALQGTYNRQRAMQAVSAVLSSPAFTLAVERQPDGWGERTKGFLLQMQNRLLRDEACRVSDRQADWLQNIYETFVEDSQFAQRMRDAGAGEREIGAAVRQRRKARKMEREWRSEEV